jgi:hypothetical protein
MASRMRSTASPPVIWRADMAEGALCSLPTASPAPSTILWSEFLGIREDDERRPAECPATRRNRDFIFDVLRDILPKTGVILEIASGSGEHVVHFARSLPHLVFQPSDLEPDAGSPHGYWPQASRMCACPLPSTRRNQFGRSRRLTGSSASTWPTFHLGRRR